MVDHRGREFSIETADAKTWLVMRPPVGWQVIMHCSSSRFAFSATGLLFLLAAFPRSILTPMSFKQSFRANVLKPGALSRRQEAGRAAFGGRTWEKRDPYPDSSV